MNSSSLLFSLAFSLLISFLILCPSPFSFLFHFLLPILSSLFLYLPRSSRFHILCFSSSSSPFHFQCIFLSSHSSSSDTSLILPHLFLLSFSLLFLNFPLPFPLLILFSFLILCPSPSFSFIFLFSFAPSSSSSPSFINFFLAISTLCILLPPLFFLFLWLSSSLLFLPFFSSCSFSSILVLVYISSLSFPQSLIFLCSGLIWPPPPPLSMRSHFFPHFRFSALSLFPISLLHNSFSPPNPECFKLWFSLGAIGHHWKGKKDETMAISYMI